MSSEDRGFKSWSSETLSRIPSGDPGFGRESRSVGKMTGKREGTTPSPAGDSREEEGIVNMGKEPNWETWLDTIPAPSGCAKCDLHPRLTPPAKWR